MIYIVCGINEKYTLKFLRRLVHFWECGTVIEGHDLVNLPTDEETQESEKLPYKNFLILTDRPKSEITLRSVTEIFTYEEAVKIAFENPL